MSDLFRRVSVIFVATLVGAATSLSTVAQAQNEPPGRVGRLAFTQGTVSFHDSEQTGWSPAVINTPLTSGDALWTEPNARSEISVAGSRVRLEPTTQVDLLAIDDSQTRMQLDQGRIDVKSVAMEPNQPYQIVTPRGTGQLLQQGDYYVEAGSTQDPTRLGVRAGSAQFQTTNGQTTALRPGQVAEIVGDADNPQMRVIDTAPPAPAAYWAARDRQVVYDQPPQYLSAGVTGYEDLNAYGNWTNDGSYGQVWVPRAVPAGWAPYRTGRWVYQPPYGWTWVDEQPWGFAPYHYGRWANTGGRWVWVPPQRDVQPVYAPALVAFLGGIELATALTNRNAVPVGWFPLGPREAYVPPYAVNRDYYFRLNRSARVQDEILRERWEAAQRREAFLTGERVGERIGERRALMNQRFATVVPANAFVRSEPVTRAALRVAPERIATVPVASVSAPPAPTASAAKAAPGAQEPKGTAPARADNLALSKTALADMPTLARPTAAERPAAQAAPGPKIAATQPRAATDDKAKPNLPPLAPRQGAAPPALKGPATATPEQPAKPGEPPATRQAAPSAGPQQQPRPAEPPKTEAAPGPREQAPREQAPREQAKPAEPPKTQAAPEQRPPLPQPQQQAKPTEPPKAHPAPAPQQQTKPAEPPKPQATPAPQAAPPAQQARPVEPPRQPAPQATPQAQPQPRPAPSPQPAPQQGREGHAAPPQPPPQQAAPPPRPAPQQTQAPQQQQPARPAPQQAQPAQQPHPAPQQAQSPQQQQQQQQPRPAPQQQQKSDDKK